MRFQYYNLISFYISKYSISFLEKHLLYYILTFGLLNWFVGNAENMLYCLVGILVTIGKLTFSCHKPCMKLLWYSFDDRDNCFFYFFVAMDIHSNWFSYDILDQVLNELYISIDYCGLQMLRLALVNAR